MAIPYDVYQQSDPPTLHNSCRNVERRRNGGARWAFGRSDGILHPVQAATPDADGLLYGRPVSIGSDGSRDHSFQEPK